MEASDVSADLTRVLVSESEIHAKLAALARRIEDDYEAIVRCWSGFSRVP